MMSYKSISTVIFDTEGSDALEWAIQAARAWDAHLHVVCVGVDSTDPGFYYAGAQAIAVQQNLELAQDTAIDLEAKTRARLGAEEIAWDVEAVTMMTSGLEPFLANHMRFSDLAILPLPFRKDGAHTDVIIFEACIFGADIPVLVVPEGASWTEPMSRIMIAWDDGAEALRATRAAMPLCLSASETEICVIDPPVTGANRSDPGGRLAQVLARSGANVEITISARLRSSIADQLVRRARETDVDLIVMGAYSHSRLREAVLGGVTRTMLQSATVPVLLAH